MTLREFASNNSTNNRASRLFVCCRQKRKRKDDTSGLNRFLIFLNGKLTLLFRYKQGPAFIFPGWRVVFVQGAKVASGPVSYTSILTWTMTTKMLREHVITNAESHYKTYFTYKNSLAQYGFPFTTQCKQNKRTTGGKESV
jgi:hypothetical protein